MKQMSKIKQFIANHSTEIVIVIYNVATITVFILGYIRGRDVGAADCNELRNGTCNAAEFAKLMFYNALTSLTKIKRRLSQ